MHARAHAQSIDKVFTRIRPKVNKSAAVATYGMIRSSDFIYHKPNIPLVERFVCPEFQGGAQLKRSPIH